LLAFTQVAIIAFCALDQMYNYKRSLLFTSHEIQIVHRFT